jgi:hypothetical protein
VQPADFNKAARWGKWVRSSNPNHANINKNIVELTTNYSGHGTITLTQALKVYLQQYDAIKNEQHIINVQNIVNRFVKYAGDIDIYKLTEKHLVGYFSTLTIKPNTKAEYLDKIKAVVLKSFKRCEAFDEIKISHNAVPPKHLTTAEIKLLEDSLPSQPHDVKLALSMYLFSYFNRGLRATDVIMYKAEKLKTSKTGAHVNLELSAKSKAILALWQGQSKEGYAFPLLQGKPTRDNINKARAIINNRIYKAAKALGINKPVRMHTARHSFAALTVGKVDIYTTKELLTHKSVATTERYIKRFNDTELAEANKKLFEE